MGIAKITHNALKHMHIINQTPYFNSSHWGKLDHKVVLGGLLEAFGDPSWHKMVPAPPYLLEASWGPCMVNSTPVGAQNAPLVCGQNNASASSGWLL